MNYEDRIVVFIDILGFKDLLNETINSNNEEDTNKIKSIISAYDEIHFFLNTLEQETDLSSSKQTSIISDSIIISFKADDPIEFNLAMRQIQLLNTALLHHNVLCRGAISSGKLLHTKEYLFGPALVEAYALESKAANYPRIILDRKIVDADKKNRSKLPQSITNEMNTFESIIQIDSDGMYYIDYFTKAATQFEQLDNTIAYIEDLGAIIRKGLMRFNQPSNAHIRVKYLWMKERYNQMIDLLQKKYSEDMPNKLKASQEIHKVIKLKKISPRKP